MSLMAMVPAKVIRSPQESPIPYFSLMGHSRFKALSRLVLSYNTYTSSSQSAL